MAALLLFFLPHLSLPLPLQFLLFDLLLGQWQIIDLGEGLSFTEEVIERFHGFLFLL